MDDTWMTIWKEMAVVVKSRYCQGIYVEAARKKNYEYLVSDASAKMQIENLQNASLQCYCYTPIHLVFEPSYITLFHSKF
jgi:hypothetical protein